MKNYNFTLAKMITLTSSGLERAELGFHEDWFWTAEEIWNDKKGFIDSVFEEKKIAGINGSFWATPVIQLTFKCGKVEVIECSIGDNEICPLKKAGIEADCTAGVMSTEVQNWRMELDVIQPVSVYN